MLTICQLKRFFTIVRLRSVFVNYESPLQCLADDHPNSTAPDLAAIGDQGNDLSMLRWRTNSVKMRVTPLMTVLLPL